MPAQPRAPLPVPARLATHFAIVAAVLLPSAIAGQVLRPPARPDSNRVWGANFEATARWAPYKSRSLLYSTTVRPRWIAGTDRFWYEWKDSSGTSYYLVDPARRSKTLIFDDARIAAELTRITHDAWNAKHLPIRNLRFTDPHTVTFEVRSAHLDQETIDSARVAQAEHHEPTERPHRKTFHFRYDLNTYALHRVEHWKAPILYPGWASVSPDSSMVVYSYQCNLYSIGWDDFMKIVQARRGKTGKAADSAEAAVQVSATKLTTDGQRYDCYGSAGRGQTDDETAKLWTKRHGAGVLWSHDSHYFALIRRDERKLGDLWVVHNVGNKRPQLETWKYQFSGEQHAAQYALLVYDTRTHRMKKIDDHPWVDEHMGVFSDFTGGRRTGGYGRGATAERDPHIREWLSPKSTQLYWYRMSRDEHDVDLMVTDPATGATHAVIEEHLNTYVEHQAPRRLPDGDLIWWSERDGWAHLYRYAPDGTLKAQLTKGPWHVADIVGVDTTKGVVYFDANAREKGEDPYYNHLYRVNLDGTGLRLLDPGDFDHHADMSASNHYFVDNYSRVNTIPATTLVDASGRKIMDLETADFSALERAGYRFPEPFEVKAADGVTNLYGVMYKPFDFDPSKKYPIVAYVYPGPQTEAVASSWSLAPTQTAMAQMGLIIVTVGHRGGSPSRSKWYHDYGYGNFRDYGLLDKKTAIEELADRDSFIDLDRVGIYGHSGGGFMSTAAMLVYPDFFKVAVSSSGNHDNNVYGAYWSEKYNGIKEVKESNGRARFIYDIEKNSDLAANLKGHLLLTVGLIDNNVPPANTFRVANALIKANKRFDLFVFPGQRHGYGDMTNYFFWLRSEYFAKWLLHDERTSVDIKELDNQVPQTWMRSKQTETETDTGGR